jgi:predicted HTH domain antitoxin
MEVKIELAEDIKRCLETDWGDVPRHALEGLAIEAYRAGVLSRAQVRRMLGFETRSEVDEFMARHGVPFDYTVEDFELDAETSRHLRETRNRELQRR